MDESNLGDTQPTSIPLFGGMCAGRTGELQWMKVPYAEGLATHGGPESCAGAGNCVGEALTGESVGRVLSRESETPRKRAVRGADAVSRGGRQNRVCRYRETHQDSARSETPSMRGSISHGNREIPRSSVGKVTADRIGNPKGASR